MPMPRGDDADADAMPVASHADDAIITSAAMMLYAMRVSDVRLLSGVRHYWWEDYVTQRARAATRYDIMPRCSMTIRDARCDDDSDEIRRWWYDAALWCYRWWRWRELRALDDALMTSAHMEMMMMMSDTRCVIRATPPLFIMICRRHAADDDAEMPRCQNMTRDTMPRWAIERCRWAREMMRYWGDMPRCRVTRCYMWYDSVLYAAATTFTLMITYAAVTMSDILRTNMMPRCRWAQRRIETRVLIRFVAAAAHCLLFTPESDARLRDVVIIITSDDDKTWRCHVTLFVLFDATYYLFICLRSSLYCCYADATPLTPTRYRLLLMSAMRCHAALREEEDARWRKRRC